MMHNYYGKGHNVSENKLLLLRLAFLTFISLQFFSSFTLAATSFTVASLTANKSVTAGYTRFGNIQLNDAGQAVFPGVNPTVTDPEGHPRTDVFFWDGTTLKNITADIPGFVVFGGNINLNQKGQIVFIASTNFNFFRTFPFFYNGTSVQNLADSLPASSGANFFREIVINDVGQVAFSGCQAVGSVGACLQQSVFLFNGSGVSLLCNECGFGDFIENLSINNRSHVAWSDHQFGGVGFFDGTSVRDLTADPVAKGAGYFQFLNPKLSNTDQIIFAGEKSGRSDVFLFNGSSLKNLTATNAIAGGAGFNQFDLDSVLSDNGSAAFVGGKISQAGSQSIFYFNGITLSNITVNDPGAGGAGFNSFLCPRINNTGTSGFFGAKAFVADSEAIFVFASSTLANITQSGSIVATQCPEISSQVHLAFFGKDASTTANRVQDIFFFDGSVSGNITAGLTPLNGISFSQGLVKLNNQDQILALGFRPDNTSDVFLLSPESSSRLITFSEFLPQPESVIKQDIDPLDLLSISSIVGYLKNRDARNLSQRDVSVVKRFLGTIQLDPILHAVAICSKGSPLDLSAVRMVVNGEDVSRLVFIAQRAPSMECDSNIVVAFQKFWFDAVVQIQIAAKTQDGTTASTTWSFAVETSFFELKDVSGIIVSLLGPIIGVLNALLLPTPALSI